MQNWLIGFDWADAGTITAATTALGTASSGVVDATKAFRGGISNVGLPYIREALQPFYAALESIDARNPLAMVEANWINGINKDEQLAATKNLIRLGLTKSTASRIAESIPNVNPMSLATVAEKVESGQPLTEGDIALLSRIDSIVEARLNSAYEKADQKYRNTARVSAAAVAMVLSVVGAILVTRSVANTDYVAAVLVGLMATPLAPVSKDLLSALSTAMVAFKSVKRV